MKEKEERESLKTMVAKTYRSKKQKGMKLEKAFATMIRQKGLDDNAQRMVLSGAAFGFETDIKTSLSYAFECKNTEKLSFWKFWEQTERGRKPFRPPVLVYSANFRPIICMLTAEDFLNLVKEVKDLEKIIEKLKQE